MWPLGAILRPARGAETATGAVLRWCSALSSHSDLDARTMAASKSAAASPAAVLWLHDRQEFASSTDRPPELVLSTALWDELKLSATDCCVALLVDPKASRPPTAVGSIPPSASNDELVLCAMKAPTSAPPQLQASVLQSVAAAFALSNRQSVALRRVVRAAAELKFVELAFRDQYLSRGEIFHFRRLLLEREPALHLGKTCVVDGLRLTVLQLLQLQHGGAARSGVLSERRCSRSARAPPPSSC